MRWAIPQMTGPISASQSPIHPHLQQNVFEQSQTCQDPNEEDPGDNNGGGENEGSSGGNSGGSSGGTGGTTNPPAQTGDVIIFRRKLPGT